MLIDYTKGNNLDHYIYLHSNNITDINTNDIFMTTTRYMINNSIEDNELLNEGITKSAILEFYAINITEEYGEVSTPISVMMVKKNNKWYFLEEKEGLYEDYSTEYKDMIYNGKLYSPLEYSKIVSSIKESR